MLRFMLTSSPAKAQAESAIKQAKTGAIPDVSSREVFEEIVHMLTRDGLEAHFVRDDGDRVVTYTFDDAKDAVKYDIKVHP